MPLNLKHQTAAQLAVRFRERYKSATREQAAKLATWLMDRLDAGDFTDAQIRSVFSLTTTQYNAMKTRMANLRTAYLATQSAAGG